MALDPSVAAPARCIWDYHVMGVPPRPCDAILVLGSNDLRVADRGAELYLAGIAPLVVVSGKVGALSRGLFPASEAEAFAERMAAAGVPERALLLEKEATNTGENLRFIRQLLADRGIAVRSAVCVQKPFMERRTYATAARQWPELAVSVTSPQLGFDAWCAGAADAEAVINTMVGDLQRIIAYPALGFQIPQDVPPEVSAAMDALIALGYDRHLIRSA